jgi:hypothetical protein
MSAIDLLPIVLVVGITLFIFGYLVVESILSRCYSE